jgi:hypothetical protein
MVGQAQQRQVLRLQYYSFPPSRKFISFVYQIIFLAMLAAESDCPQAAASTLKILFDI